MISFENISKQFGNTTVLNEICLSIPKNKITFIIGRSGEGKSVTIKHIIGLLRPDSGRIIVDDEEITDFNTAQMHQHRKKFGMLFQHSALFDSMSVLDNVIFPLREHTRLSRKAMRAKAEESLARVGLGDVLQRYPSELSTGEKKRTGLARALVNDPHVLLYDEPTTGMDPLIAEMIDNLIVKINDELPEVTSVVISHDIKATLATADKIIMIYKGKVVLEGNPDTFRNTDDPVVCQFMAGQVEGPMQFI